MKKLNIDMELLLELSSEDTKGEGESYLNRETGEFSYIPLKVINAIGDNSKLVELEEWEKELIQEAKAIIEDYDEKYLYISIIDEEFNLKIMKEYAATVINLDLREKLISALNENNYINKYNSVLMKYDDIDNFYDFKDNKSYEYLEKWLLDNGIEIIK